MSALRSDCYFTTVDVCACHQRDTRTHTQTTSFSLSLFGCFSVCVKEKPFFWSLTQLESSSTCFDHQGTRPYPSCINIPVSPADVPFASDSTKIFQPTESESQNRYMMNDAEIRKNSVWVIKSEIRLPGRNEGLNCDHMKWSKQYITRSFNNFIYRNLELTESDEYTNLERFHYQVGTSNHYDVGLGWVVQHDQKSWYTKSLYTQTPAFWKPLLGSQRWVPTINIQKVLTEMILQGMYIYIYHDVYIYIYTHMCLYIYIHIYKFISLYIWIYTLVYTYIYIYIYVYIYV